jgi:pyruvate dehydrogenase E2 component (dihydrolipoamide acetyltransferase)
MLRAVTTAAMVTHVDEADVTELVALRERSKGEAEKRGVKLTYLPFIIKALIPALQEFPYLNASLDDARGEIVLKRYYNIGVAVDTDDGLVVPVVKDADRKSLLDLAREVEDLAERARKGQLALGDVQGSTFTITNVGALRGLFATPILNPPEVAILGVHRISKRPVVHEDQVVARDLLYLSLTFDHRMLDGVMAARFMGRLIEGLEDPKRLGSPFG